MIHEPNEHLRLQWIPTYAQVADAMTKSIDPALLLSAKKLQSAVGLIQESAQTKQLTWMLSLSKMHFYNQPLEDSCSCPAAAGAELQELIEMCFFPYFIFVIPTDVVMKGSDAT